MHRRRDRLHHPQALTVALVLGVGTAAFAPARADVQRITSDGYVHRVDVDIYVSPNGTGTGIRYTRQKPLGGRDTSWVTGTDDVAIDRDPSLDVEPSGKPVVVWARNEGSGFDLYIARLDNGAWTAPSLLVHTGGDDTLPQIRYDDRYLHVAWRQQDASGAVAFYRSAFDPATWAPTYGPERIPTDDLPPIPPSGGTSSPGPASPSTCLTYFSGVVPGVLPGDPGRTVVWGVRDEPLPISYHQVFTLPPDATNVTQAEAAFIGGRFTLWFVSGSKAYYTVLTSTGWSSLRVDEINAQTTPADVRAQIHELNRRTGPQ